MRLRITSKHRFPYSFTLQAAAGKNALMLHIEDWRAAGVTCNVKAEATAAGTLKTPVWDQVRILRASLLACWLCYLMIAHLHEHLHANANAHLVY